MRKDVKCWCDLLELGFDHHQNYEDLSNEKWKVSLEMGHAPIPNNPQYLVIRILMGNMRLQTIKFGSVSFDTLKYCPKNRSTKGTDRTSNGRDTTNSWHLPHWFPTCAVDGSPSEKSALAVAARGCGSFGDLFVACHEST